MKEDPLERTKDYKSRGQDIPIPEDLKEYYGDEIGCAFGYPEEWEERFNRIRQKIKNRKDAEKKKSENKVEP
jgi:hypothetical protein